MDIVGRLALRGLLWIGIGLAFTLAFLVLFFIMQPDLGPTIAR
jgi:hypothetical protein